MVKEAQHVGEQTHERDAAEHDVEVAATREVVDLVGRRDRDAGHTGHDRRHRDVLVASRRLVEHPLAHDHQHEQPCREGRLHDHQGREFEGDHLQRPTEHREPGAKQPSPAPQQPRRQREAQVCVRGRLLGVHRLESDPYAVEDRGANRREQPKDEIEHARR